MKIYVSESSDDLVNALTELLGLHCEITLFNNLKETEFDDGSFVFYDFEVDKKRYSKSIKFFKKNKLNLKLVLIVDSMSPKEIKKHQGSKVSANFYLKFPLNFDLLSTILDIEDSEADVTPEVEEIDEIQIQSTPQEFIIDRDIEIDAPVKTQRSDRTKAISDKLDDVFNSSSVDLSVDSTAQVTGILEEIILDDVMEEFEDITSLDPTPEQDHTIKIEYESDQLFPDSDDLEYPDFSQNHEKQILNEITDELELPHTELEIDDNLNIDSGEVDLVIDSDNLDNLEDDLELSLDSLDLQEESLDMSSDEISLDDLDDSLDLTIDDSVESEELNLDLSEDNEISLDLSIDTEDDLVLPDSDLDIDLGGELSLDDLSLDSSEQNEDFNDLNIKDQDEELNLNLESDEHKVKDEVELSIDLSSDDDLPIDLDLSSKEEDLPSSGLKFDTLEPVSLDEKTSNDIQVDEEEDSFSLTEPDLGFTKKTVAAHEINQMDNSLHFAAQKEETKVQEIEPQPQAEDPVASISEPADQDDGVEINSDEIKFGEDTQPKSDILQSQLDEIDIMMSEDSTVKEDEFDTDFVNEKTEAYSDEQLIKLTETIKFLRMDRDQLESKLRHIEDGKIDERRNVELYKSQLEEKGIEIGIMSKRYNKQIEKLQRNLEEANKQKEILLEKNKLIASKIDQSISKKEYDISKIRKREIELENKLEMLKSDTQVQLKTREDKIIELKRRIDTLEFDMSTIQNQESKSVVKRTHLEDKLDKVIDTLRDAIEDLENRDTGLDNIEELSKRLKDSI